ncbi:tyrosine-type recombinase/integrase [Sulfidibacter corallicola]|uniref:tyrosine-type recombinase/integrase n=1 Tax=Sulfidibacter corallicola TaxID=2818388 RepID=UPI001F2E78ED|nr:site-specific integrase [Sulfidibacter corallicola]
MGFLDRIKASQDLLPLSSQGRSILDFPFSVLCDTVSAYVAASKKTDPATGRLTNPRSVNRRLYALSSFFQFLQKAHGLSRNPVEVLDPAPMPRKSSTKSPSADQISILLTFLSGYRTQGWRELRNTTLLCCCFLLALRRSEAVNLRWSNIDFHSKTLRLTQKGGTEKHLPIPPILHSLLIDLKVATHLRLNRSGLKEGSHSVPEPVFISLRQPAGRPLSASSAYGIVQTITKKALPGSCFSPHAFRKAFVELALTRGNDLVSIANATGHSTIEMVKYYDTRDYLKHNAIHDVGEIVEW